MMIASGSLPAAGKQFSTTLLLPFKVNFANVLTIFHNTKRIHPVFHANLFGYCVVNHCRAVSSIPPPVSTFKYIPKGRPLKEP